MADNEGTPLAPRPLPDAVTELLAMYAGMIVNVVRANDPDATHTEFKLNCSGRERWLVRVERIDTADAVETDGD